MKKVILFAGVLVAACFVACTAKQAEQPAAEAAEVVEEVVEAVADSASCCGTDSCCCGSDSVAAEAAAPCCGGSAE